MSTDIKVGDLVYVARPMKCCGAVPNTVSIFTVKRLSTKLYDCRCGELSNETAASIFSDPRDPQAMPLYTLEKFRYFPESELRDVTRELEKQS